MPLQPALRDRLTLPLIAAPMFLVSGPELVIEACTNGVIGAFPCANCRSLADLERWLTLLDARLGPEDAPYCPNLIMSRQSLAEELACLIEHRVELVITSVGSPAPVIAPLHEIGCTVFADVASLHHARKAIADGADGLILLTAGAGGQTGWVNGLAFARAVRGFWDGPLVLAGGVSDGQALWAAEVLGCDLAYMGTKFIATAESMAAAPYKAMLASSELDDIVLTNRVTGLDTNLLAPSLVQAGLDPKNLASLGEPGPAAYDTNRHDAAPKPWKAVWSAGHSVSGVAEITSAAALIAATRAEYDAARASTRALLDR